MTWANDDVQRSVFAENFPTLACWIELRLLVLDILILSIFS
jgi:hypothetical protein